MQYKLVMFMSRVCCCLPHGLLMAAGRVLGNLYYLLIKKQRERAVAQMMPALGVDEARARQLVKESFVNLARNVLEILYMPALTKENFSKYVEIDHLERMEEALAEGKGVVVLTGHIGTWEWLSAAFTMNDMPVTAIAKPQPNIQYTPWARLSLPASSIPLCCPPSSSGSQMASTRLSSRKSCAIRIRGTRIRIFMISPWK